MTQGIIEKETRNGLPRVTPRDRPIWPPAWLATILTPEIASAPDPIDPSDPDAIDIPANSWRWHAANLPAANWSRWRNRSAELQTDAGLDGTDPETRSFAIGEADRLAYGEIHA